MDWIKVTGIIIMLVITVLVLRGPAEQSYAISKSQGTVLSPNWWEALNWIKENTAECSTIATYWDPGHFITGIARRAVVFDGASQNSHLVIEKDGVSIERARIKDIATTLFTDNETLAVEILKDYKKPGCNEMYYIASADLIGKSTWWTYFATWKPEGTDRPCSSQLNKGSCYNYMFRGLSQTQPLIQENGTAYTYPITQQESFLVFETESGRRAFIQRSANELLSIERFIYAQGKQFLVAESKDPGVPGTLLQMPNKRNVIFMSPELENSLFTRLMFFDGAGLKEFTPVGNWGGEVKLYRINFIENQTVSS